MQPKATVLVICGWWYWVMASCIMQTVVNKSMINLDLLIEQTGAVIRMKCPYCGKEMSKGYIRNPRGVIAWTPEGEKANVMQSKAKEYQIELGEHSGIGVTTVEAEYCDVDGIFLIRQKK